MNTLHNVTTLEEARTVMKAIDEFRRNTGWPQHRIHGKRNGGMARFSDALVWVWRTRDGWHGELQDD